LGIATVESQLKIQVRAQGFGLTTERDLEVRIDLTGYIGIRTTQFGLTIEKDLQLGDN